MGPFSEAPAAEALSDVGPVACRHVDKALRDWYQETVPACAKKDEEGGGAAKPKKEDKKKGGKKKK